MKLRLTYMTLLVGSLWMTAIFSCKVPRNFKIKFGLVAWWLHSLLEYDAAVEKCAESRKNSLRVLLLYAGYSLLSYGKIYTCK